MRFKFVSIFVVMVAVVGAAVIAADAAKKDEKCTKGACPVSQKANEACDVKECPADTAKSGETACGAEKCPKGKEACDAKECPADTAKCAEDCDKCGTAECPKVVAVVDGKVITVAEIDEKLAPQYEQVQQSGQELTEAMKNNGRYQVAQQMVTEVLVKKAVENAGIKITQENIDAKIAEVASSSGQGVEDFMKMLEAQGVSKEEFTKRAKLGIGFEKLMEKESADQKLTVTEEEAKETYMNQPVEVKASHILVSTQGKDESAKAEAKTKAEEILAKVKDGDFAELAKENSDCPSSERGGDLGFFAKGRMVKPFSDAAFAMKVGEISDIVETQFGYHIIKVTDRKEPDMAKFEEQKEQLMAQEEQKNKGQFAQQYLQSLVQNAKIEYNEAYTPKQQQLPQEIREALEKQARANQNK